MGTPAAITAERLGLLFCGMAASNLVTADPGIADPFSCWQKRFFDGGAAVLERLGLGGDGDEIEAIEDVERDFGVSIDTGNALEWRTVGDVYDALLLALPDYIKAQPNTWRRFCRALCQVTADDPVAVGRDTILIGKPWGLIAGIKRMVGK